MVIYGKVSKDNLSAINFFAERLFSSQLSRHIHVKVSYIKMRNHWGLTCVDDYNKAGKPRYFTLQINRNLKPHEKLMTISHELVHVKQYALMELNEEMTKWCGEDVNIKTLPYHKHPWEIEAYDLGDRLFDEYIEWTQNIN